MLPVLSTLLFQLAANSAGTVNVHDKNKINQLDVNLYFNENNLSSFSQQ